MRTHHVVTSVLLLGAVLLAHPRVATAQTPPAYCGPADIVFVIDDTNATSGVLASVKAKIAEIIATIERTSDPATGVLPDYRVALVTFKDAVDVRSAFTTNGSEIITLVNGLTAVGGGSGSGNAVDEALRTVINALSASDRVPGQQIGDFALPFRGTSVNGVPNRQLIVLLNPSQPGGFDDDYRVEDIANAHQRALDAKAAGIKILAVYTPLYVPQETGAVSAMQDFANTTGGSYIRTDEPVIVDEGTAVLNYLQNCQQVNHPPAASCSGATVEATNAPACTAAASINFNSWDWEDDLASTPVAVSQNPAGPYRLGSTSVTLTATDSQGAFATCSDVVTVTCPGDSPPTVELDAIASPVTGLVPVTATAHDDFGVAQVEFFVDGNPIGIDSASPFAVEWDTAGYPHGSRVQLSAVATDSNGQTAQSASVMVTIDIIDTTPPAVTVPANATIEATGPTGAPHIFTASALDNVDGAVTPTCSPGSGTTFPIRVTTVTCTATDAHGNSGSATFTVTVVDTTAPSLTLPSPITTTATNPAGAPVTYSASATDLVDGSVTPACTPTSGSTFPVATTTVTCTATDAHQNAATGTFTVTVTVADTTPPVVTVPATATLEATGPSGAVHSFTASATDNLDGPIAPTCSPASGATFPLGATQVTCSATDAHNNTGTASFTVTVVDTTKPVLTLPSPIATTTTSPAGAAVTYTASAMDLVDGSVVPVCTPASGTTFVIGTTTVTCTATDAHQNAAIGTFTVTVRLSDATPPIVTITAPAAVEATGPAGARVHYTVTAADNVDPAPVSTCTPLPDTMFALGATTIRCTARDAAGNVSAEATATVNVRDTTPPDAPIWRPPTSVTPKTATLSWNAAPDIVGVAYYRIYELVRHANSLGWEVLAAGIKGLSFSPGAFKQKNFVHTFVIVAVDGAGNESMRSAPLDVDLPKK